MEQRHSGSQGNNSYILLAVSCGYKHPIYSYEIFFECITGENGGTMAFRSSRHWAAPSWSPILSKRVLASVRSNLASEYSSCM